MIQSKTSRAYLTTIPEAIRHDLNLQVGDFLIYEPLRDQRAVLIRKGSETGGVEDPAPAPVPVMPPEPASTPTFTFEAETRNRLTDEDKEKARPSEPEKKKESRKPRISLRMILLIVLTYAFGALSVTADEIFWMKIDKGIDSLYYFPVLGPWRVWAAWDLVFGGLAVCYVMMLISVRAII